MSLSNLIRTAGAFSVLLGAAVMPAFAHSGGGGHGGGDHGGGGGAHFSSGGAHYGGTAHFSGGTHYSGHVGYSTHFGGYAGHYSSSPAYRGAAATNHYYSANRVNNTYGHSSFAANSLNFNRSNAYNTGAYGRNGYAGYFGRGYRYNRGFGYGLGYGLGYGYGYALGWDPWYGYGLGGWLWNSPYGYYLYDYAPVDPYAGNYYSYTYAPTYNDVPSGDYPSVDYPQPIDNPQAIATPPQVPLSADIPPVAGDQLPNDEALQYYSKARSYFERGDYQSALRAAQHAQLDAPSNASIHELISLSLFALRDYTASASEAHAAMVLGAVPDWSDLLGYYYDPTGNTGSTAESAATKYTAQLRALEKASNADPKSAAEHYLLAYHYLMTRARANAKSEFTQAARLTPEDHLASFYLKELQENKPITPPQIAAKPQESVR